MTSILLLGGSGYVGAAFRRLFDARRIEYRNLCRAAVDYTNPAVLAGCLREQRPAFVVNAAGYTGKPNVDACELHKADCLFGNAVLPGLIARTCADAGVPWGHVSSGCIYNGTRSADGGFTEDDPPNFSFRQNNCSFYSGTKALGEELLAHAPH
jgi:dTDP-4-dehydrorhamnose reductase